MTTQRASLDHLTVAAQTLVQGVAYVQRALGVTVPSGGAHPLMATHNCLMQLGESVFLEIIAPDPAASPHRPRWFSLDDPRMQARLQRSPQLISWVVRVSDLGLALSEIGSSVGEAVRVTRGSLSWLISVPPDGSMPYGGAFPTLIEWPPGAHPTSRMIDLNCGLEHLAIVHPEGGRLAAALDPVFRDERVSISNGAAVQLRATIKTPVGLRELT
jgi:TusA-related sulfurtransferase